MPPAPRSVTPRIKFISGKDVPGKNEYFLIKPVWCARHHFTGPYPCSCPAGPSILALNSWCSIADELLLGGARGGMKTETGIQFLIIGNSRPRKVGQPWDETYLKYPKYRALVLRENLSELEYFMDRADAVYSKMGGRLKRDDPPSFEWPNGAKIIMGYLKTDADIKKYLGPEYHRILIEQAEQIAQEQTYVKLFGSMRSTQAGIYCQALLTANPGSGPGQGWIKNRFIDLYGPDGEPVTPTTLWRDPTTGKTRVFIPSKVFDNPFLMRCPECSEVAGTSMAEVVAHCDSTKHAMPPYLANLLSQSEHIQRAWIDGDWDALAGSFFYEYRDRRLPNEPPNALHVIPRASMNLEPYWNRWMGMDWGRTHPSVVLWFCENPDTRQIFVYREMAVALYTPQEVGAMVATQSIDDLRALPQKVMVIALSPDAFGHKESEHSIADQFRDGIENVLGPKSAFVMAFDEYEKQMDYDAAWKSMLKRRDELKAELRIVVIQANNDRIGGWAKVRDMLRWKPLQDTRQNVVDVNRAQQILEKQGLLAYYDYIKQFEKPNEVLPKLQIAEECRELRRSMKLLIFATGSREGTGDAEKMDGDDPDDCLRMGLMMYEPASLKMPESTFVERKMNELVAATGYLSPTSLINASNQFRKDFKSAKPKHLEITPRRNSRGRPRGITQFTAY